MKINNDFFSDGARLYFLRFNDDQLALWYFMEFRLLTKALKVFKYVAYNFNNKTRITCLCERRPFCKQYAVPSIHTVTRCPFNQLNKCSQSSESQTYVIASRDSFKSSVGNSAASGEFPGQQSSVGGYRSRWSLRLLGQLLLASIALFAVWSSVGRRLDTHRIL